MGHRPSAAVQFTPYEISMCLYDIDRTKAWKEAIEDTVRKGDVVVDAGAGTGILGLFAALSGASRVYAVEVHPRFCGLISRLAERNGVADKITVICADAAQIDLPEKVDVVVCELLCTGQFFEPEVQVVNNLRRFLRDGPRVIPQVMRSYIQLIHAQQTLYGVRLDSDSRSMLLPNDEPLSSTELYDTIDLTDVVAPESVDTSVTVRARKTGLADAVVVTSRAQLTHTITAERSRFLYNPEIIYLKQPVQLLKGMDYEAHIAYPYGGDTLCVNIEVEPRTVIASLP